MKKEIWLDQNKICQMLIAIGQTNKFGLGYKRPIQRKMPYIQEEILKAPLTPNIRRPSISEIQKFLPLPDQIVRGTIDDSWIKNMIKWDMEIDLHLKKYKDNLTSLEQGNLGQLWQQEMDSQNA